MEETVVGKREQGMCTEGVRRETEAGRGRRRQEPDADREERKQHLTQRFHPLPTISSEFL